jgi:ABC-type multidrug transport system, ATPase component
MAGLEEPDDGEVFYDRISAVQYPEQALRFIGFMPDTLPDSMEMRVWEYLDFFARAYGLTGQAKTDAMFRVGELTNLENLPERFLSELSKGMKQQVSLARVLLHDPAVLLLDEPAAGLDPRARIQLRECLRKLATAGKTILISSHILSELEDIADGVIIIEKGKLVKSGGIQELNQGLKTSGFCRVILSFPTAAEPMLPRFREFSFAETAEIHSPKQILLAVRGGETEFSGAMAELFSAGLPIIGMTRPDYGLEGVFLNTTKGEVQ